MSIGGLPLRELPIMTGSIDVRVFADAFRLWKCAFIGTFLAFFSKLGVELVVLFCKNEGTYERIKVPTQYSNL